MLSNHLILCHPHLFLPLIFPNIRLFYKESALRIGGQNIGALASASVLPMNIQDSFPLGLTGWISLQSKGLSRVFSNTSSKASVLRCSAFLIVQLSHPYMILEKKIALTRWTFVGKVMSLLSNTLSGFVIAFFPRSKNLYFVSTVIIWSDFGAQENKICHCFHFFSIYLAWSDGTGCRDLSFLNVEF